ncbi:MAG: GNAT family N-acetyltransferase [Nitrosopumilus sp.]|nr:GNAT family N-acetyltransferase [Nitrosopumilus sp.]CAI9832414.1 Histone acetyltransferase [Nitrosopumilaceae archaeon]MDA7942044.1 GNAT family N-acetyltransferase [Nitrosopumilus sp.]MDA7943084.1 GNAT family N-acetyltransferase [Nitrosopumilus sp.]MDA7945176.1 GNAT family N-acetyltransferase [Nitrosopumilus sp.]
MDVSVRELRRDDLWNGFLRALDTLRPASSMGRERAGEVFERIDANPDQIVLVAEAGGRIAGTVTLFIDQKFIHDGGRAGHVEDLAVLPEFQGMGVGAALMGELVRRAAGEGCYKTVLNCPDHIVPFQAGNGFRPGTRNMRYDH